MRSFLNYSKNRFLYGLLKFGILFLLAYLGFIYFGCIDVYAADTTLQLTPKSITININNQNLTYAPTLNAGWAGYDIYTYSSAPSTDWERANILYTYNDLSSSKLCTQSNGVATVQGKFIAGTGALGGGAQYLNETSGTIATCDFKISGVIGTFTCHNVHLNDGFSFVNIQNPGGYTGITRNLDITCGEMTTGQAVDSIINNDNKNTQDIIDNNKENTDKIVDSQEEIKDAITDDTPPNLSGLEDSAGWLPAGPVDSILNLPISLLNNLTDNLGGSCQPANLTVPFINKEIILPCMSEIYEEIGISSWINTIGTIASAFIAYYYLLELYKWVDNVLTIRENTWNDVDQWGGI